MYKVELVPVPARIQVRILESLAELKLNRNKLANDCLATLISLDQRGLMESQAVVAPAIVKNKMFSDSSKPRIIKLRKDLVDYMEMQSWNKSGAINQALYFGLREIAAGARFASNYQSGRRQHYRPTAANQERKSIKERDDITLPWSYEKCMLKNEWAGAQICGFCIHFNPGAKHCRRTLQPTTGQSYCSRFSHVYHGDYFKCFNCMHFDGECKQGVTPNPHYTNCQQYYPAP